MSQLPRATVTLDATGGGVAKGSELLCIMSCSQSGPIADPRLIGRVQAQLDEFGRSEGLELGGHNIELNDLPHLFIRLATATAGAITHVDASAWTGTSLPSASGTPLDDEEIHLEFTTAGTRGTNGSIFRVSRDGGRTWSGYTRLGTATSYVIPDTGITIAFSYGTLAGTFKVYCQAPRWDAAGLTAAFTALAGQSQLPRLIVVCGDVVSASELQTVIDRISAYESSNQRHAHVICNAIDRRRSAAMQKTGGVLGRAGSLPADVDFDAGADTITRDSGSWLDDGFAVGDSVTVTTPLNIGVKGVISALSATVMTLPSSPGLTAESNLAGSAISITSVAPGDLDFTTTTITRNVGSWVTDGFKIGDYVDVTGTASNNTRLGPLTNVSATVLTFAAGGTSESNVSALGVTITRTQLESDWQSAVETIVGVSPSTQKTSVRTVLAAGRMRRLSPVSANRKRRPYAWALACRTMGHDLHVSAAKVENGPLEGWGITDDNGVREEHDDRVAGGFMASIRVAAAQTHDVIGVSGVYAGIPVTLAADDAPLSRLPVGLVGNLACTIAKSGYTRKLNTDVETTKDKIITRKEAERIDAGVTKALRSALLARGLEGARASDVTATMDRSIPLTVGATVPVEVLVTGKSYIERFDVRVRVDGGA